MRLYKNMKVKVRSLNGRTDFHETLLLEFCKGYISPISVHNLPRLRTLNVDLIKENGFTLKKQEADDTPQKLLQMQDYVNDMVLFVNTPTWAESLLHSLEQEAGGFGLHVNADKMEYMCFYQKGDISTLNDGSLKLVDKFTYLESSVSLIENDMKMRLAKA